MRFALNLRLVYFRWMATASPPQELEPAANLATEAVQDVKASTGILSYNSEASVQGTYTLLPFLRLWFGRELDEAKCEPPVSGKHR